MSVSTAISNRSISINTSSEDDFYKKDVLTNPGVPVGTSKKTICKIVSGAVTLIALLAIGYLCHILNRDPWVSEFYDISRDEVTKTIYLHPKGEHTSTFIFLHGLTMHNEAILPVFSLFNFVSPNARIILPQAPEMQTTVGLNCTSFFDIMI